jgi:DMSO/TMAO reductase YedYZ molybdopterin-dependent catalytic subunit
LCQMRRSQDPCCPQALRYGRGSHGSWENPLMTPITSSCRIRYRRNTPLPGGSIPIDKAVDGLGDCLSACEMKGSPLPRDHGYPVRVIAPGHAGARQCNWVHRVIVSDQESQKSWLRGFCFKTWHLTECRSCNIVGRGVHQPLVPCKNNAGSPPREWYHGTVDEFQSTPSDSRFAHAGGSWLDHSS